MSLEDADFDMPQPFSRIVSDPHIFLDPNALEDKPAMAVLVTKIFATWAKVEHELSFLLVRVLGADAAPAIAMHEALTAQHLQNSALQAAAKAALNTVDLEIFQAALSTAESAQTPRNHLAHWIWGGCKQRPELLALADPKMIKKRDFRVAKFYKDNPNADANEWLNNYEVYQFDPSFILGYSEADLVRALRDLTESYEALFQLGLYLNPESTSVLARAFGTPSTPEEIREGILHKLNDLRLFREALDRIRKDRDNTPQ